MGDDVVKHHTYRIVQVDFYSCVKNRTTRVSCINQDIIWWRLKMSGILGKKIGMTQIFEDGKFVPVTVVEAGPNFVLQKKT